MPSSDFDEGAVGGHVAHLTLDLFAGRVALFDFVPRILFELAEAERDFLLVLIDAEHDGFDFLADRKNIGGAHDALGPGEFGNVDEAFDALFDLHKRAVGNQVRDLALDALADGEALFDFVHGLPGHLLEARATRALSRG